jgi:hypothetical protein
LLALQMPSAPADDWAHGPVVGVRQGRYRIEAKPMSGASRKPLWTKGTSNGA